MSYDDDIYYRNEFSVGDPVQDVRGFDALFEVGIVMEVREREIEVYDPMQDARITVEQLHFPHIIILDEEAKEPILNYSNVDDDHCCKG